MGTVDENLMVISPDPSLDLLKEEQVFFPTKRKGSSEDVFGDIKRSVLDNEEEKKTMLRGIYS